MVVKPPPAGCNSQRMSEYGWEGRKDLDETRIQKDESIIRNIASTVESMVNPFEYSGDDLINICSGNVAPANVKADLGGAYDKGVNAVNDFEESRLKSAPEKLFQPIKSNMEFLCKN